MFQLLVVPAFHVLPPLPVHVRSTGVPSVRVTALVPTLNTGERKFALPTRVKLAALPVSAVPNSMILIGPGVGGRLSRLTVTPLLTLRVPVT